MRGRAPFLFSLFPDRVSTVFKSRAFSKSRVQNAAWKNVVIEVKILEQILSTVYHHDPLFLTPFVILFSVFPPVIYRFPSLDFCPVSFSCFSSLLPSRTSPFRCPSYSSFLSSLLRRRLVGSVSARSDPEQEHTGGGGRGGRRSFSCNHCSVPRTLKIVFAVFCFLRACDTRTM